MLADNRATRNTSTATMGQRIPVGSCSVNHIVVMIATMSPALAATKTR
jgi:hypothetical protein